MSAVWKGDIDQGLPYYAQRRREFMTLIISNEHVQQVLDDGTLLPQTIIDAIEGAYRDLGAGKSAYAPAEG